MPIFQDFGRVAATESQNKGNYSRRTASPHLDVPIATRDHQLTEKRKQEGRLLLSIVPI
jgi:hypothetical protein